MRSIRIVPLSACWLLKTWVYCFWNSDGVFPIIVSRCISRFSVLAGRVALYVSSSRKLIFWLINFASQLLPLGDTLKCQRYSPLRYFLYLKHGKSKNNLMANTAGQWDPCLEYPIVSKRGNMEGRGRWKKDHTLRSTSVTFQIPQRKCGSKRTNSPAVAECAGVFSSLCAFWI